jgi:hypothetical protein
MRKPEAAGTKQDELSLGDRSLGRIGVPLKAVSTERTDSARPFNADLFSALAAIRRRL